MGSPEARRPATPDAGVPDSPEVRVLRGAPDDAELAALIAVLSAVRAAAAASSVPPAVQLPRPRRFQAATSWRAGR